MIDRIAYALDELLLIPRIVALALTAGFLAICWHGVTVHGFTGEVAGVIAAYGIPYAIALNWIFRSERNK